MSASIPSSAYIRNRNECSNPSRDYGICGSQSCFIEHGPPVPPLRRCAQVNVTTYHNMSRAPGRTPRGVLTPGNVNSAHSQAVFVAVDGVIYAQPLYLSSVSIAEQSTTWLYVATEHDSVYAIDAEAHHLRPCQLDPAAVTPSTATPICFAPT